MSRGGRVFVDNEAVLQEVVSDSCTPTTSPYSRNPRRTQKIRGANPEEDPDVISKETTRLKNIEHYRDISRRIELDAKKGVERTLKQAREKAEQRFEKLTNDIVNAQQLLDTIDDSMALQEEAARNKTRRQFEDWNQNVHGKIQGEILQKVNAKDYKQLNRERNSDYAKFLNITNRKSAIFRDIIIESEYDPLEPNRRSIKAVTGKMKDPTLMILQKHQDESGTFTKKKEALGRDSLNVELWAAGQIEATPYGRFNKMMGISDGGGETSSRSSGSSNKISGTMRSTVKFDHYNFPQDKAALDAEMPKGKRSIQPYRNPKETNPPKPNGHPNDSWMF